MKKLIPMKLLCAGALAAGMLMGSAMVSAAETADSAKQAIEAARAVVAEADAMNWIWRDTEEMLKNAETAAAEGDNDNAVKLANEAKAQAELAMKQHEIEMAKKH